MNGGYRSARIGALLLGLMVRGQVTAAAQKLPLPTPQAHPRLGAVGGIAQTPDGYLWFGAREGLQRFDGVETLRYTAADVPALRRGGVHRVLAARDGGLWLAAGDGLLGFGTGNTRPLVSDHRGTGALVYLNPGTETFTTVRHDGRFSDIWIWGMAETADGTLWLGTEHGLAQVAAGAEPQKRFIQWEPCGPVDLDTTVSALAIDAAGSLWLATDRGVFVRRNRHCTPAGLNEPVMAIAIAADGHVFAGTQNGLVELFDGAIAGRLTEDDGLPYENNTVQSLLIDRGGFVWVGTGGGILRLDRKIGAGRSAAFPSVAATTLLQDSEDSVWIGTSTQGAFQFRRSLVDTIGQWEGLAAVAAFAVASGRDGSVWATTASGVSHISGQHITNYAYGREVPGWSLRSLAEGSDGTWWFAAGDDGLVAGRQGVFTRYSPAQIPALVRPSTVAVSRDGALWVGREDGALVRFEGGTPNGSVRLYGPEQGGCGALTLAAAQSADGTMWWGTRGGLMRVRNGEVRCFTMADGLPSNDVASVLADADGTLWLGSRSDAGLARFRNGRAQVLGPALGLPPGGAFQILDDGAGHLWWSSAQGLHRAARKDVEAVLDRRQSRLSTFSLGLDDGLRTAEMMSAFHPAGTVTSDGRLWFPSAAGLVVVKDPDAMGSSTRAIPLVAGARSAGRDLPLAAALRTAAGAGDIEIRFTAPSFLLPHRLQFQHRLDGLDAAWVDARTRRTAHYANLSPGQYRFRVRASDARGIPLAGEAAVNIVVPPRYYQTWWFRLSALFAVLALAAGVHRNRLRAVRERSIAVLAERSRIARDLHDHLGQSLGAIGFLSDALRLSSASLPEKTNELVGRLGGVVVHTRQGVDELIWDLRAGGEDLSLDKALGAVVARARSQGAEVKLTLARVALPASPLQVQEIPFIVQEAITNAIEHGRARAIVVAVDALGSNLEVTISDDGIGWGGEEKTDGVRGGFGVVGMRERAHRLKGTLAIAPRAGETSGTVIKLAVPLQPRET